MAAPSSRYWHSGWEFEAKLWTFGGGGPLPQGFLNWHGDYLDGCNNQILSFCPSSERWTNPKYSGSVPCPRKMNASTVLGNIVWLYGGGLSNVSFDDQFQLNMHSLTWTEVHTDLPRPCAPLPFSVNAISDTQLLWHGGV